MTTILVTPGGRPKRDIIDQAFEELGSAGYEFERTPEEALAALRRLNLFMGEWPWNGLTYYAPPVGHGAPEDFSGLPDSAISAVAYELAQRLAGLWGTELTPGQKRAAALAKAQAIPASVPKALYPRNTPAGAGNRFWRRTYLSTGE